MFSKGSTGRKRGSKLYFLLLSACCSQTGRMDAMHGGDTCSAEDARQTLLVVDAGTSVVVGVVLAMAVLITVGACCGYFYGSWAQECEHWDKVIRLQRANTELKAKIQHLSYPLVENKCITSPLNRASSDLKAS